MAGVADILNVLRTNTHPTRHRGTGYNGCGRIEKEHYYAYGRKRDTTRKMLCDEQQGKVHGSRYKPWHSYFLKLDHRRNKLS